MNVKDAILSTIAHEKHDTLVGRTRLQKKLYFVAVLTGEDFDFRPHFYGPYSPTVADELAELVEAGFIREEVGIQPNGSAPLGERRRYSYTLDPSSKEVLKERAEYVKRYSKVLQRINSHPVSEDPRLLPVAAKVHFILAENGGGTVDQIRQRASELGWSLSDTDVNEVISYLQRLRLVTEG
jgi:uncharacterized protein